MSRRTLRGRGVIFMIHRFSNPETGVAGHDAKELRRTLAYLRQRRFELLGLQEMITRLAEGDRRASGAIAFTIDDGYLDQATVGSPVFGACDCPVTSPFRIAMRCWRRWRPGTGCRW